MKPTLIIFFWLIFMNSFGQADKQILERELFNLPNVSFTDVSKSGDAFLTYDLLVKQPIDHQHPEKGYFNQWVQLKHRGFENPTVMETHGYQMGRGRNEVEQILNANNIGVEYRFFGKSVPDSLQWEYLTIEQAAADLHVVNQLFKQLYKGKWISTGISKSGQTTLYYKYFYPEDVDVAIPYVAPIDNALEDTRIYTFLDTIGKPECRQKIYEFQKFLLMNEDKAIEKLNWYAKGARLTFNYTGNIGKSFELAVLEYSFSFWQSGRSCDSIPTNKKLDDYLGELLKTSSISFFSDKDIESFAPHYYQATQTGYYGYNIEPFRKYIQHFTSNPSAIFPPKTAKLNAFSPELYQSFQKWLDEKGNNILYIYGGIDTWSAPRVLVSKQVNSKSFLIPGAHHGSARIKNLPENMKAEFVGKIKEWTGLDCKIEVLKTR
ncbi:MAG: S28 family serine protease [Bacteroidota bacterium]|nr:S28 family serine protease [Bacteroidota bacterium]